ncbi:Undecaprenyl pyrophosphate synthetase [Natronincola peptidivorans]|uniref:Isoprenyl transferase n=1 Tax=Natronincola peptidivorans TaxID=426128 RepID=A0A1H9YGT1_9FIRM|nr:isoprenyl transferase [Natronincola peptidivorans]SES68250.1 Undecaprenyl pyrophosphate synthetase [Natronincola peptidivorans]
MRAIKDMSSIKKIEGFDIDIEKIPKHIAIIMDGNGRWAQKRKLPRALGHRAGVDAIRDVIETSSNIGISYLSIYAFSTENWKRPQEEISTLMKLLIEYLRKEVKELHKNNVRINTIGNIKKFPEDVQNEINKAKELTEHNNGLCVNIALNYGGRDEITRTVKKICNEFLNDGLVIDDIDEKLINAYLDSSNIPDPDLLIRTSGEYRLSNFLLWQCAYSELWFTEVHWPDFTGKHLLQAIEDFQKRQRRFGGI